MSDFDKISNKPFGGGYHAPLPTHKTAKKEKVEKNEIPQDEESPDIATLVKNDPHLQAIVNKMALAFKEEPEEAVFNINKLLRSLIDLSQKLQGAALAYADRLSKVTEKLNAYVKLQTQLPVILKGDIVFDAKDDKNDQQLRADFNQKIGMMLEAIRANKGLEEDKAKKIQTSLSAMKDAGTAASDFVRSFIDLIRTIASKINQ